jgi:nucleoside triphosphate pyrophosphatase
VVEIPVPVVLASSSTVRHELLRRLVDRFEVVVPRVDESAVRGGDAPDRAMRLAELKARQVAALRPGVLVIAADTLVVCDGEIIGKPVDRADAVRIMRALTASSHRVVTGFCVMAPDGRACTLCSVTHLRLRAMSDAEIECYVDTAGALDRAGVYALQPDDPNVLEMRGSATCVMGLPMDELEAVLREFYPQAHDQTEER